MIRAHVFRSDCEEWCATLHTEDGRPLEWAYAETWNRAMLFASIGLRRGGRFPEHRMSGEIRGVRAPVTLTPLSPPALLR